MLIFKKNTHKTKNQIKIGQFSLSNDTQNIFEKSRRKFERSNAKLLSKIFFSFKIEFTFIGMTYELA